MFACQEVALNEINAYCKMSDNLILKFKKDMRFTFREKSKKKLIDDFLKNMKTILLKIYDIIYAWETLADNDFGMSTIKYVQGIYKKLEKLKISPKLNIDKYMSEIEELAKDNCVRKTESLDELLFLQQELDSVVRGGYPLYEKEFIRSITNLLILKCSKYTKKDQKPIINEVINDFEFFIKKRYPKGEITVDKNNSKDIGHDYIKIRELLDKLKKLG